MGIEERTIINERHLPEIFRLVRDIAAAGAKDGSTERNHITLNFGGGLEHVECMYILGHKGDTAALQGGGAYLLVTKGDEGEKYAHSPDSTLPLGVGSGEVLKILEAYASQKTEEGAN